MHRFEGVIPAIITPMTAEGGVNEEAFRQVMDFNIQCGVQGFWVAGGTGESVLLDDAENRRIAEIASDQAQGRVRNIMHVGALTTDRAARLAEHAARAGVDAICCVPPFFYRQDPDGIVAHYRTVAAAADLPFFVYNVPGFTAQEITLDLMERIQAHVPQLAGLKHSAADMGLVHSFARMGLACLIGNSTLMLPALTLGAAGCVDGPPNVAPELWVAIWQAYQAGDLPQAMAAQARATAATEMIRHFSPKFHAACKAALSTRLGIDCGVPRRPAQLLTPAEHTELLQRLQALDLPVATGTRAMA